MASVTLRFFALLTLLPACGYQVGALKEPIAIRVGAVMEQPGIDIDAAGLVDTAVRQAVARSPNTHLRPEAERLLEVELVDVHAKLAPFSDRGLRALQYQVSVRLRGRLKKNGRITWRSPVVVGVAPFLSPPGRMEVLDGHRRRAMAQATEEAAERLISSLVVHRN